MPLLQTITKKTYNQIKASYEPKLLSNSSLFELEIFFSNSLFYFFELPLISLILVLNLKQNNCVNIILYLKQINFLKMHSQISKKSSHSAPNYELCNQDIKQEMKMIENEQENEINVYAQQLQEERLQVRRRHSKKAGERYYQNGTWLSSGNKELIQCHFNHAFYLLNFENQRKCILVVDDMGTIIYSNRAACQLFQGCLTPFQNQTFDQFVIKSQRKSFIELARDNMGSNVKINYMIYSRISKRKYANYSPLKEMTFLDLYFRYLKSIKSTINPILLRFEQTAQIQGYWSDQFRANYTGGAFKCFIIQSTLSEQIPAFNVKELLKDEQIIKFIQSSKKQQEKLQRQPLERIQNERFEQLIVKSTKVAQLRRNKLLQALKYQKMMEIEKVLRRNSSEEIEFLGETKTQRKSKIIMRRWNLTKSKKIMKESDIWRRKRFQTQFLLTSVRKSFHHQFKMTRFIDLPEIAGIEKKVWWQKKIILVKKVKVDLQQQEEKVQIDKSQKYNPVLNTTIDSAWVEEQANLLFNHDQNHFDQSKIELPLSIDNSIDIEE